MVWHVHTENEKWRIYGFKCKAILGALCHTFSAHGNNILDASTENVNKKKYESELVINELCAMRCDPRMHTLNKRKIQVS